MKTKKFIGAVLVFLFLAGASYAQDADQGNPPSDQGAGADHPHHAPPQAAIDACSGKSEGDACDYTNSKGEDKSGTCANTKDNQLFCKRARKSSS